MEELKKLLRGLNDALNEDKQSLNHNNMKTAEEILKMSSTDLVDYANQRMNEIYPLPETDFGSAWVDAYCQAVRDLNDSQQWVGVEEKETIADGFGGVWSKQCPTCGEMTMQVVRPGKVQCSKCP